MPVLFSRLSFQFTNAIYCLPLTPSVGGSRRTIMGFHLPESHQAIRQVVRNFVRSEWIPVAREQDRIPDPAEAGWLCSRLWHHRRARGAGSRLGPSPGRPVQPSAEHRVRPGQRRDGDGRSHCAVPDDRADQRRKQRRSRDQRSGRACGGRPSGPGPAGSGRHTFWNEDFRRHAPHAAGPANQEVFNFRRAQDVDAPVFRRYSPFVVLVETR